MISAIAADPISATYSGLSDPRARATLGDRGQLPNSTPASNNARGAGEDGRFPNGERQQNAQPEPDRRSGSAMFAAAVIAGALPPTPETLQELFLRIGASPIPEESEARLKDIIA